MINCIQSVKEINCTNAKTIHSLCSHAFLSLCSGTLNNASANHWCMLNPVSVPVPPQSSTYTTADKCKFLMPCWIKCLQVNNWCTNQEHIPHLPPLFDHYCYRKHHIAMIRIQQQNRYIILLWQQNRYIILLWLIYVRQQHLLCPHQHHSLIHPFIFQTQMRHILQKCCEFTNLNSYTRLTIMLVIYLMQSM